MGLNTTCTHGGRMGNMLFMNIFLSEYARRFGIAAEYKYADRFDRLGIGLFRDGGLVPAETVYLTDDNALSLLRDEQPCRSVRIENTCWLQQRGMAMLVDAYIRDREATIRAHNRYRDRYDANTTLFVQVRLGDFQGHDFCMPFQYYDRAIRSLRGSFTDGVIASDSPDHPLCRELARAHGLTVLRADDPVETVMFGSTCRYIILSSGTFSWMIGVLAFTAATILYPDYDLHYGDYYVFPSWRSVAFDGGRHGDADRHTYEPTA